MHEVQTTSLLTIRYAAPPRSVAVLLSKVQLVKLGLPFTTAAPAPRSSALFATNTQLRTVGLDELMYMPAPTAARPC